MMDNKRIYKRKKSCRSYSYRFWKGIYMCWCF